MSNVLSEREWNYLEDINNNDASALESIYQYDGSIEDAIVSESLEQTPIYYSELYNNCSELADYVNEALQETPLESATELVEIMRMGARRYYYTLFNNNKEELIYNYGIRYANGKVDNVNLRSGLTGIDFSDLEDSLDSLANSDYVTFDDIKDTVNDFFDSLEDGEDY